MKGKKIEPKKCPIDGAIVPGEAAHCHNCGYIFNLHLLFVCTLGKHRSRTAAEMTSVKCQTRYRGIYGNIVTVADMKWASEIYVFEEEHRKALGEMYPDEYLKKKIINLDIPDVYSYNQKELISLIAKKLIRGSDLGI